MTISTDQFPIEPILNNENYPDGSPRKFKSLGHERPAKGVWKSATKYRKNRKRKNGMAKASRKKNR